MPVAMPASPRPPEIPLVWGSAALRRQLLAAARLDDGMRVLDLSPAGVLAVSGAKVATGRVWELDPDQPKFHRIVGWLPLQGLGVSDRLRSLARLRGLLVAGGELHFSHATNRRWQVAALATWRNPRDAEAAARRAAEHEVDLADQLRQVGFRSIGEDAVAWTARGPVSLFRAVAP
jgi:hypothetical protein